MNTTQSTDTTALSLTSAEIAAMRRAVQFDLDSFEAKIVRAEARGEDTAALDAQAAVRTEILRKIAAAL
jgi:hypothetical protein